MRNVAMQEIVRLAETDDSICFVGSDLGFRVMDDFQAHYPNRIFREGICEQHVVGLASGLALEGKRVYVNTIASFLVKRCLEQISLDLCSTRLPVCLLGNGGGVLYAPLGPTHLIPEDFALLRTMPDMTIFAPCDAVEMKKIIALTTQLTTPSYIRIGINNCPVVCQPDFEYALGKAVNFTPYLEHTTNILFLTTGMTVQVALEVSRILANQSVNAMVLHYPMVKPFDQEALLYFAEKTQYIIALEEHCRNGGLGTAALEFLADANILHKISLHRIGLPDTFFSEHGSRDKLVAKYGISVQGVLEYCKTLL